MADSNQTLVLGSRDSSLAMTQTQLIKSQLLAVNPSLEYEILSMKTIGDKILDKALNKIGDKNLFTKELEVSLAQNNCDLVVHSLKDMPTTLNSEFFLGAISEREDPNDALVLNIGLKDSNKKLQDLEAGSVIGTSSVRRIAQLKRKFPNLVFKDIRGNLNTRLAKLDNPENGYAGIILAIAGLKRLGFENRISQTLTEDICSHAVGQGALGVECRVNDNKVIDLLKLLDHRPTRLRCTSERAMMRSLEGGCSVPIGATSSFVENQDGTAILYLKGVVVSLDGSQLVQFSKEFVGKVDISIAEKLGVEVADELVKLGAKQILDEIKNSSVKELPFGK